MENLDLTKPIELYVSAGLIGTDGNYYPAGIYEPGVLPDHFVKPEYCRTPVIVNSSPIPGMGIGLEPLPNTNPSAPPLVAALGGSKLNINTADITQISKIEGISTAMANKIAIDRDTNGAYADAADLIARQNLSKIATTIEDKFSF